MPISVPNCIEKNRKYKHNTDKNSFGGKLRLIECGKLIQLASSAFLELCMIVICLFIAHKV